MELNRNLLFNPIVKRGLEGVDDSVSQTKRIVLV